MNPNKIASLLREEVEGKDVDAQKGMNKMGDECMKGDPISDPPQADLDLPGTPKSKSDKVATFKDIKFDDFDGYADYSEDDDDSPLEK